jgi:hypothetical protein
MAPGTARKIGDRLLVPTIGLRVTWNEQCRPDTFAHLLLTTAGADKARFEGQRSRDDSGADSPTGAESCLA